MVIVEAKVLAVGEHNPSHQYEQYKSPSASLPAPDDQLAQLKRVLDRFEVSIVMANELVVLEGLEIVMIADDSGSMQSASLPAHMRKLGQPQKTRFDEMKESLTLIVDLAVCFDKSGVDVHFLNRPSVLGVKSSEDRAFVDAFKNGPSGSTPLTERLQSICTSFCKEKTVLLIIFTDGEPNGGSQPFARTVRNVVAGGKVKIQVMACTADDDEIGWLNVLDKELSEMDVTDDYTTEKAEVLKYGLAPEFSKGDWVMKAMLGPIVPKFDKWDEVTGKKTIKKQIVAAGGSGCCSIS